MKKLLLSIVFMVIFTFSYSQLNIQDGKYYVSNDLCNGEYTEFYDSGEIHSLMYFKNGLIVGKMYEYDKLGKLIEIRAYSEGEFDGIWTSYKDGKKTFVASYKDGIKDGKWLVWNDKGNIVYEINYKLGKKISTKEFDDNGKVIKEHKY